MRVFWVLEKIHEDSWKKQIECLLKSVKAFKEIYPDLPRTVYCDEFTGNSIESLGILQDFSETVLLDYSEFPSIDSKVFWASSKLRAFKQQKEEFIYIDNDFYVKKPFLSYLDLNKCCFSFEEIPEGLYPTLLDPYIKALELSFRPRQVASNMSFLYFPGGSLVEEYAKVSLDMMEKLSFRKVTGQTYMLFAEQLLFLNLLQSSKIPYQKLVQESWHSVQCFWENLQDNLGIFSFEESKQYFFHEGPSKIRKRC